MWKSCTILGTRSERLWIANVRGMDHDLIGDLEFTCPRCEHSTTARFYGPCERCREQLRDTYRGAARDVTADAYAPKMNVTPNAVALKDS